MTASFTELGLSQELLKAVEDLGFEEPSPIQVLAIPALLTGKDAVGQAQTGTGKTAAFGLPILEKIASGKSVQALVLCPTRELAIQVSEELSKLAVHKRGVSGLRRAAHRAAASGACQGRTGGRGHAGPGYRSFAARHAAPERGADCRAGRGR